jgi:ABC-type phosphate/phosphonate transport system substrate-binding protein
MAARDSRVDDELLILAKSPTVPSNALGVRGDLDPAIKQKLVEALLNMAQDPDGRKALERFGAVRFLRTTKEDYVPVFDVAKRAGIDLRDYEYVNE